MYVLYLQNYYYYLYCHDSFCNVHIVILMTSSISTLVDLWNTDWLNEWMNERTSPADSPLYRCMWVHTKHSAVSDSGLRESSWDSRKKPNRFEQHHVVCWLSIHIPLYVSSHTEHSAVSDSGLRESSWDSRKKPNRFEQHHVAHTMLYLRWHTLRPHSDCALSNSGIALSQSGPQRQDIGTVAVQFCM